MARRKVDDLRGLVDLAGALEDLSRLRILLMLGSREMYVGEIAESLAMSQPIASHHLRLLRMNGLVTRQRKGKQVIYSLAPDRVQSAPAKGSEVPRLTISSTAHIIEIDYRSRRSAG